MDIPEKNFDELLDANPELLDRFAAGDTSALLDMLALAAPGAAELVAENDLTDGLAALITGDAALDVLPDSDGSPDAG